MLGLSLLPACEFDLSDVPTSKAPSQIIEGCFATDDIEGTDGVDCTSEYEGVTDSELAQNLCDPKGACANLADITGICTKDPSGQATSIALICYLRHDGDDDPAKATRKCTLLGEQDRPGLTSTIPEMSEDCLGCYADVIVCAAERCADECRAGDAPCSACYEREGCLSEFFACSGLKSKEDIQALSK